MLAHKINTFTARVTDNILNINLDYRCRYMSPSNTILTIDNAPLLSSLTNQRVGRNQYTFGNFKRPVTKDF